MTGTNFRLPHSRSEASADGLQCVPQACGLKDLPGQQALHTSPDGMMNWRITFLKFEWPIRGKEILTEIFLHLSEKTPQISENNLTDVTNEQKNKKQNQKFFEI